MRYVGCIKKYLITSGSVTTETITIGALEDRCNFAWWLFTPYGLHMLIETASQASSAKAVEYLQLLRGFGCKVVVAKGKIHTIVDVDRCVAYLALRIDEFLYTSIGPNPHSLINLEVGKASGETRYMKTTISICILSVQSHTMCAACCMLDLRAALAAGRKYSSVKVS